MVPAIQVEQVVKRYGELQALAGVSLEIAQGEFFGLLGPNGAGKTTLISILAGLAIASSGSARVMGYDVVTAYRKARRALGVVPQELVFDPFFTVREALTTHYLEEAEALCGRIAMLKQGQIVADDTTQNLLRRSSGCYVSLKLAPHRLPDALTPLLVQQDGTGFRLALTNYDAVEHVMATLRDAG